MQIVGDTAGADEFTPPQTFARDVLDWMEFKDINIDPEELPRPTTWHVLIMPKQPKKMSTGGIVLPAAAQDVEAHMNYIGQVVAMGPLAGQAERFMNPEWWPPRMRNGGMGSVMASTQPEYEVCPLPRFLWNVKVGDWVIYGRYSGMHKIYKDVKFLTVNDDDITDIITSPAGFKVYT